MVEGWSVVGIWYFFKLVSSLFFAAMRAELDMVTLGKRGESDTLTKKRKKK